MRLELLARAIWLILVFMLIVGCRVQPRPAAVWSEAAKMGMERSYFGLVPVDGKIYAIGGGTGEWSTPLDIHEVYDPRTNTWTPLPPLPTARRSLAAAAVGPIIYAIGGGDEVHTYGLVEAFDTRTQTWSTRAPMPTPRIDLGAVALNGLIYTIGGFDGYKDLDVVEIYDPQTDTWRTGPPLPRSRYALNAVALDGLIYAIGGRSRGELSTANEVLDPKTGVWTERAPMSAGRSGFGAAVVGDRIHVVAHTDHESYSPRTNSWRREADLPYARHSVVATSLDGTFFAVGGCSEFFRDLARVDIIPLRP